jgi:FkbM family methyltransferase
MGRAADKLRLSRALGATTAAAMALFGLIRVLGRRLPWDRWLELNEFLDALLDRGGTLARKGDRVAVEQHLDGLGGRLGAELRPGTSDLATWFQIAGLEEYAAVVRFLGAHSDRPVRTVVDAGANIGLASLYLARAFPDCRILALEPDADNFRLLAHNLRDLGDRVACVQAAFWPVDEPLEMNPEPFRGGREWARTVRRTAHSERGRGPRSVPVVTPADADARLGGEGVDLLKMDIEGAEAEFFTQPARRSELLCRIGAIAIEVHPERMDPHEVLLALDDAGFLVMPGREILVGIRRDRLRRR